MRTHREGHAAGWYADPHGGPGLRWWDGHQWTHRVMPPPPPAPGSGGGRTEPRPRRLRDRWGGPGRLGIFGVVLVVALLGGQRITGISVFGVSVDLSTTGDEVGGEEIEQRQSELIELAGQLETSAQAADDDWDVEPALDLTGLWWEATGLTYEIEQFGTEFVIQELTDFGVSAVGQGVITDDLLTFDYVAYDGSSGEGELIVLDDWTLDGWFHNFHTETTVPVILTR